MTRAGEDRRIRELQVLCTVPTPELCYLRHTLEAYEGLCVPTTLPGGQGRVRLVTSPAQRPQLEALLLALGEEFPLVIGSWSPLLSSEEVDAG